MAVEKPESQFNDALCARVKALRQMQKQANGKPWTAAQMAGQLGVPAFRYRKYEDRSPMPAYLMPKFCFIVGVTLEELLGQKPLRAIEQKRA